MSQAESKKSRALGALRARMARVSPLRWVLAACIMAAFATLRVLIPLDTEPDDKSATKVEFLGQPLKLDRHSAKVALKRLRAHVGGLFVLTLPDQQRQQVSFGDLGVVINKGHLVQLLRDSADQTSPLSRVRKRQRLRSLPIRLPAPLELKSERTLNLLYALKREYDRPPRDARLDLAKRQIIPSTEGLLLNIDATLRRLEMQLPTGARQLEVVFERVAPSRRTEQLTGVRFDHVLAAFETHYDRSMRGRARTHNLRVAASKLDGYVVLPGETFDFNRVVGPRDESNGYKVATVIAQGELVDGIGGGTCQISGTLHGAAFFGGMDIVERYPHTRPSSYIKLGLDATVVYPTINFRIANPYDFPVVLHQTVKNGSVRAEILGPPTDFTTTLIRRIENATPYENVERPDPSLASGERVLAQRGIPGFTVRMYRVNRKGAHATRDRWLNKYPPTAQIIRVGTGASSIKKPKRDGHPEYVADELLVVTQTTKSSQPRPRTSETREAGRFGVAGWTKKAGMPVFKDDR